MSLSGSLNSTAGIAGLGGDAGSILPAMSLSGSLNSTAGIAGLGGGAGSILPRVTLGRYIAVLLAVSTLAGMSSISIVGTSRWCYNHLFVLMGMLIRGDNANFDSFTNFAGILDFTVRLFGSVFDNYTSIPLMPCRSSVHHTTRFTDARFCTGSVLPSMPIGSTLDSAACGTGFRGSTGGIQPVVTPGIRLVVRIAFAAAAGMGSVALIYAG